MTRSSLFRSTQYWNSPGSSPVSAPRSNIVTTTTFTAMGRSLAAAQATASAAIVHASAFRRIPLS
jgi:hypothetical protein